LGIVIFHWNVYPYLTQSHRNNNGRVISKVITKDLIFSKRVPSGKPLTFTTKSIQRQIKCFQDNDEESFLILNINSVNLLRVVKFKTEVWVSKVILSNNEREMAMKRFMSIDANKEWMENAGLKIETVIDLISENVIGP